MKKNILILVILLFGITVNAQKRLELTSPDGKLEVTVRISDKIYYDIACKGKTLLKDNYLQMTLKDGILGENPRLLHYKRATVKEQLNPVVPLKFSTIDSRYNLLLLKFKGYSVEFRAFDDGIAYRFVTDRAGMVYVTQEDFAIRFPADYLLHLQQPESFKTPYEEEYTHVESNTWKQSDRMSTLPILIDTRDQCKILISETNLSDYPCMFLKGTGENGVISTFPKVPLKYEDEGDLSVKIIQEADYIAYTDGRRNYPWRYFIITQNDGQLIESTLPYKLADRNLIKDVSWIAPGQVSWEWWHDASPYGPDVNFVTGCNFDTYKYYIDFASSFHIPYIILDAGWAEKVLDPFTPNPYLSLQELISYGKEKNVGIILWLSWLAIEKHFDFFKTYQEWGIKGVKIDFMDRSDQWMVNFYERVAREAAKYQLLVDFHGSFKPAGLECKYPNVLSYEGVKGLEHMRGCYPDNSVFLPFMRNVTGPMDYTPGAMTSMQPDLYSGLRPNSSGVGTRAYQMALFVIFESGLQMLADNPTLYYRNEDCTRFISQIPVTWDETIALASKAGEYAIVAKRRGDKWFIGGMANNKEPERTFSVKLDFLAPNRSYKMNYFEDGINAGHQAMDYRNKSAEVKSGDSFTIKMVKNGGFVAVIE